MQARINVVAGRQWGVLRQADLLAAGLTSPAIWRWSQAGRLHHLYRGVYSLVPPGALAPEGRDLAAVWACGGDAVLASVSAAVRWGLLRHPPPRPQVLVASSGRRAIDGIELRVTSELPDSDRTVKDAVPVTTVERTILDLAAATAQVSDRALESAAAQAERDGWFRRPAQLRTAARARHRAGSPRLRTVLRVGPRLWRSDEEALAAAAIVEAGLPEPVIAHRVRTAAGVLEVDLGFPDYRVVLEVDGGQHALTLNAARDVDRDAALDALGWVTVRVTAAAVRADATAAARAVRPVLVERGWPPGG